MVQKAAAGLKITSGELSSMEHTCSSLPSGAEIELGFQPSSHFARSLLHGHRVAGKGEQGWCRCGVRAVGAAAPPALGPQQEDARPAASPPCGRRRWKQTNTDPSVGGQTPAFCSSRVSVSPCKTGLRVEAIG